VGCIAGAMLRDDYLARIARAGFRTVEVVAEDSFAGVTRYSHASPDHFERQLGEAGFVDGGVHTSGYGTCAIGRV
jgi:hypothetical protein